MDRRASGVGFSAGLADEECWRGIQTVTQAFEQGSRDLQDLLNEERYAGFLCDIQTL